MKTGKRTGYYHGKRRGWASSALSKPRPPPFNRVGLCDEGTWKVFDLIYNSTPFFVMFIFKKRINACLTKNEVPTIGTSDGCSKPRLSKLIEQIASQNCGTWLKKDNYE